MSREQGDIKVIRVLSPRGGSQREEQGGNLRLLTTGWGWGASKPASTPVCIIRATRETEDSRCPSVRFRAHLLYPPQPLPETRYRRCQSGPGSGSYCQLPGLHSFDYPGRPWSAPVGPVPGQRSGSGSPFENSLHSWAPLEQEGRI